MNPTDKRFLKLKFDEEKFPVIIEISKGMKNKYEIDKKTGLLVLDRILYTSTHYPQNYGYIPLTLCDDGDALDCLVISSEEIIPFSFVMCKAIGIINMIDSGKEDYKILAVPINDPFYNKVEDLNDLPEHLVDEIKHFFSVYKYLENKETEVKDIGDKKMAKDIIRQSFAEFKKKEELI